jgi:hypothetical protein
MALIGDLVLQTSNSPGTATFNLIAPVAGRVSFVAGNGAGQAYYIATDGTNWEKGYGTVTAGSPDTLSRDTVIRNSLGTTAKINFTSTVTILSDIPAERAIYAIADNGSVAMAGRAITGLGAALAADHAPRFDQVRWTTRATTVIASSTAVVAFTLPADCIRLRLEIQDATPASTVAPYIRFSYDGGVTYSAGASDYGYTLNGATETLASFIALGPAVSTTLFGAVEFSPTANKFGLIDTVSVIGSLVRTYGSFRPASSSTATNILFGFVGQNISIGRFSLVGSLS